MKQTGFRGIADVFGEVREVEFNGRSLTLSDLSWEEAQAIIVAAEGMGRRVHYGAPPERSISPAHAERPLALEKPEARLGVPARTEGELAVAGGRGAARESIEEKPAEASAPPPPAPSVPAEEAGATRGRKRATPTAPASAAAPATNGAAKNGANGAHAVSAAVAPHVGAEFPAFLDATPAERDTWVKLAAKEIVAFRGSAPAYLDEAWAHLLATAPAGWFKKHLEAPKATKAEKAAEAKQADIAKQAEAHRATNAGVLEPKGKVATAPAAAGAPVAPPEIVEEIRKAFGINPALLAPAMKQILVDRGVDDGYVPPALAGELDAAWALLLDAVPPGIGWFQAHSEDAKKYKKTSGAKLVESATDTDFPHGANLKGAETGRASSAAKPNDPLGLAPEGVDPDADPIEPSAAAVGGIDLAEVQAKPSFRDVLSYLANNGVKTQAEMIATCLKLRKDVPVIMNVADLASRIPRALATVGIDLPA